MNSEINGQIRFLNRRRPGLAAGEYRVEVKQSVIVDGKPLGEFASGPRLLAVRGERFALDPNELLAVFPPRGNRGDYSGVLPHVIFERRTLPWERSPERAVDNASWLALLLFDEAEAPRVTAATVSALARSPAVASGTLPAGTLSYPDAYAQLPCVPGSSEAGGRVAEQGPQFRMELDQSWDDPCQIIDVDAGLFARISPSLADLQWVAHVRQVNCSAKAGGAGRNDPDQENAVLVGTRLPRPGVRAIVHLVSLEGLAPFLRASSREEPPKILANADAVRLISLANWSFTADVFPETFAEYLEDPNFDVGPLRAAILRPTHDPLVDAALARGYVALPHHTRLDDHIVSWFRGPLIPGSASGGPGAGGRPTDPVCTADEMLRFDPELGMLDTSYAGAWQLGRLLGMRSTSFSQAMLDWRRTTQARTLAHTAQAITANESAGRIADALRRVADAR